MKPNNQMSNKSIEMVSDYNYFDILCNKKYQECTVRIPETILIEKGFIKQWLFNSSKTQKHPILKKKKTNLNPINVLKSFCHKLGYSHVAAPCETIIDLKNAVKSAMKQQKDYQFIKDKKIINVITVDDELIQMTLNDFLTFVAESKYSDTMFYQKWKMIQQKVSFQKVDETYQVESVRKNHIIQSKCQKIISLNTALPTSISTELIDDTFKDSSPSKKLQASQIKTIQGYKFFDTFLNKKFFQMNQQLMETIEKNYKCIVESIITNYVINKDRQPHFIGIKKIMIKPVKKITEMRQYSGYKSKGYIKVQEYQKLLYIYIIDFLERGNNNNSQNLTYKLKKCYGDFCDCKPLHYPSSCTSHLQLDSLQSKLKLPSLMKPYRHINYEIINAVRKRKQKVVQKMKSNQFINDNYQIIEDESSDYQSENQTSQKNEKVCENCFIFYQNVAKIYDIDNFGNMIEKKVPSIPFKNYLQNKDKNKILASLQNDQKSGAQKRMNSPEENLSTKKRVQSLKSSVSHTRFLNSQAQKLKERKAIEEALIKAKNKLKLQPILDLEKKSKQSVEKQINQSNLTSLTKIKQVSLTERVKPIKPTITKQPQNFQQAVIQLVNKLSILPSSSDEQFIYYAKKYYKENLPQYVDRRSFSSQYITNVYQFNNNSIITLPLSNRIKKRPQMSMKRLSQLTDYPQIVSKSAFIFDTLICDEQTTIPFCVITTKMIGQQDIKQLQFENIIIVHDLFDSYIEHIAIAKNMIEQKNNKRVILFNRPGQSHTIYNEKKLNIIPEFGEIIQKLLYRLSNQKGQLKILDHQKDSFKFIGYGYGGYLVSSYLAYYHYYYSKISGVLLINSFGHMPESYKKMVQSLLVLYQSNDPTAKTEGFLYYNKAIQSTQINRDDLDRKSQLNSIKQSGRAFILRSVIQDIGKQTVNFFQSLTQSQVYILYGVSNVVVPKQSAQQFIIYQNRKKQQIPNRKFFQADGGHDLIADNIDQIQYRLDEFILLNS